MFFPYWCVIENSPSVKVLYVLPYHFFVSQKWSNRVKANVRPKNMEMKYPHVVLDQKKEWCLISCLKILDKHPCTFLLEVPPGFRIICWWCNQKNSVLDIFVTWSGLSYGQNINKLTLFYRVTITCNNNFRKKAKIVQISCEDSSVTPDSSICHAVNLAILKVSAEENYCHGRYERIHYSMLSMKWNSFAYSYPPCHSGYGTVTFYTSLVWRTAINFFFIWYSLYLFPKFS